MTSVKTKKRKESSLGYKIGVAECEKASKEISMRVMWVNRGRERRN